MERKPKYRTKPAIINRHFRLTGTGAHVPRGKIRPINEIRAEFLNSRATSTLLVNNIAYRTGEHPDLIHQIINVIFNTISDHMAGYTKDDDDNLTHQGRIRTVTSIKGYYNFVIMYGYRTRKLIIFARTSPAIMSLFSPYHSKKKAHSIYRARMKDPARAKHLPDISEINSYEDLKKFSPIKPKPLAHPRLTEKERALVRKLTKQNKFRTRRPKLRISHNPANNPHLFSKKRDRD